MRTLKNFMLLLMTMSLVTFTSCKSDDDGGDGGDAPSGTLIARIDGANFQSLDISSSATVANNGNNLIIIASNSDGNAFSITIVGYSGPGTYPLGGGANIFNSASYTETDVDISNPQNSTTEIWQAPYDDTQVGEVNISEETENKIMGTFNFNGKNVNGDQSLKDITNGSFNLDKQTI
ncbi:DUF6252 family protein [Winogradskyella sp.]|jgi:hypothetical protein|uniref:DUF6252 family protein n=1 Tax=Winogradskyella sp. TaxID=1883156 RepID=UPI0025F58E2D|nr:DUF6252 family protein [Winogradskyella sp.]MCT4629423.1 DUF6252 family protein [Winogradskyella sp.]